MLESFHLNPTSDVPLFRQLYSELRTAILSGRISAGTRMPSTRDFAADLGVSRNTVLNAFDQLIAEGYLQGKTGSGTYVSPVLVLPGSDKKPKTGKRLSQRGRLLDRTNVTVPRKVSAIVPFRPGVPALEVFPMRTWLRLQNSVSRKKSSVQFGYQDPAGFHPLRHAIAQYLRGARGVRCEAAQVIIVAGSQQGLDLTARVCADVGDRVWVENPGYLGARGAFTVAGLQITGVPVDEQGMNPEKGSGKPRLICVTPSYQFPLGVTMSLARRMTLLDVAHRCDSFVIEDDYDSEFRYAGRPLAALQGLDNNGRVIYIGTFSKVLFPGLRLGYVVVPEDLTHAFVSARALLDRQPPILDQMALAQFIEAGYFNRHIRKMRKLYGERQNALLLAMRELQNYLSISPSSAGMHLVGWLKKSLSDQWISDLAAADGIEVPAVSAFCIEPIGRMGLLFGYAAFDASQMKKAARALLDVLKRS